MDRDAPTTALSRRMFLTTASAALVGATLDDGLAPWSEAAKRHPQRGGVLLFGTRVDITGLDSHRNTQYHVSHPAAALYTGLTDIDQQGNIVPGIAESWEPNQELTAWVFRLRKGVLFHNGREVDAEAVKLNILRMKDPAIGTEFQHGAIHSIQTVDMLDKYTVRFNLSAPDASLPANVMHYPTNLQAPDAFDSASEHPIGTGPFKFVSWTRWQETRLVRFENYWETDSAGHNLPYLDEIIGKPKKEDTVRLAALRTGQIHLIDNIAYLDVERFQKSHSDKFTTWDLHLGGVFVVFNFRQGPFQDQRLRTAAAHAIDRNAIHHSAFYGRGTMLDQPYPRGSPWYLEDSRSLAYDPDKAKALLKAARAVGTVIDLICVANLVYNRECAQIVQEMWHSVGFKVTLRPLDDVPLRETLKKGDFHGYIGGNSYRFDPDGFFERNLHSKSDYAQSLSGWRNEPYDRLVEEAKKTLDPARRRELYTAAWNIVNVELPHFHLHELTMTSAAAKEVKGYQPCEVGPLYLPRRWDSYSVSRSVKDTNVLKYIFYRVLQLIPVWLLLSMFVFAIVHALPGDAIDALVPADAASNPATRAALEKELGLDKPLYVQYARWLGKIVLHGDFGRSITTRRTISVEIFKRLPATIYLAVTALTVSLLIAIPLGTIAAVKRRTLVDYTATATALTGISIPEFWLAILFVLFFALYLGWLPASEYYSPFDNLGLSLKHLVLPATALGVRLAAITTRLTRSAMLDEVRKEYVDTARALGLPERRVIYKYTLRNALIPTVTVAGLQFARLLGGTVVIESIFSWPGVGLTLYEAILGRDYPMVQAAVLIVSTAFVLMNLLVDLTYRLLNPRIRLA